MMAVGDNSEGRSSARAYLEEQSALVRSGGYWNCLAAARELSALLLAEGRSPWIARLRRTEVEAGRVFVKATWTTHYVCCCEGMAYDPVAGKPTRLEAYSLEVFGEQISLEVFVPAVEISDYLERPCARPPSSRP